LIKSAYHGWLSMMTLSEGPLFSLVSGSLNLTPTTAYMLWDVMQNTIGVVADN